jgi:hypothetical protein
MAVIFAAVLVKVRGEGNAYRCRIWSLGAARLARHDARNNDRASHVA